MKKFIFLLILTFISNFISLPILYSQESRDGLYRFIMDGDLTGRFGAAFNFQDFRAGDSADVGEAWGLLDLRYKTPGLYGFRVGTWLVGVQKIWENHQGDYDSGTEPDYIQVGSSLTFNF